MCGLVGLQLHRPDLEPRLGHLLGDMLMAMTSRGPDSAGVAVYTEGADSSGRRGTEQRHKLSVLAPGTYVWPDLVGELAATVGCAIDVVDHGDVAVLVSDAPTEQLDDAIRTAAPELITMGTGDALEVYKHTGSSDRLLRAYGGQAWSGYQAIGHTRMATESAVTTAHSHPFAPSDDVALVHNGSLSNHSAIRRRLSRRGVRFDTDNDSEVAARLISEHLEETGDLETALRAAMVELDGFYTFLVTTRTEMAVVRDSSACKPAVIAETESYVAIASEYHALAGLPGILEAKVFEPMPSEVHVWKR